jgi:hypothetical protein
MNVILNGFFVGISMIAMVIELTWASRRSHQQAAKQKNRLQYQIDESHCRE